MPPSDTPNYDAPSADAPPPPAYRPMREPDGGDNSMRNLALAAVAIAAVVMGGVYVMSGRHHAGVPVIEPDPTPLRVKPANPGGMQVAGADDSVLMNKDGTEADSLAPPPETPAPQALQQQTAPPPMSPPVASAPPAMPPPPVMAPPPPVEPQPVPLPAAPPAPPVARHAEPTDHAPSHDGGAHAGSTQVQLAALESEAAANAEWTRLSHRAPDLFAGHTPSVMRVERDGKTFFRLRTGGFPDIAAATMFCAKLRGQGGSCTIASF